MLSLPSLAPQDSYALWYTSANANNVPQHVESPNFDQLSPTAPSGQNVGSHRRHYPNHRTPLARLRHDEEYMERRKQNVQNYGNSWIKPPGIPKSLYQLREEKREMEEHQESLRREALAQELAEAEAEGIDELLQDEGIDGAMEDARDLDDEVPEAEITGLDGDESENEDENDVEDVPRGVLAARLPDDVYREALVRGQEIAAARFGDERGSNIDDEDPSQMLQEEDLVHETRESPQDMNMDMDADLDADIPEAETGGYEHTDTEAELTSSDDDSIEVGNLGRRHPVASSMIRSDGTQNSLDMFSNGSSQMGSSPRQRSGFGGRNSAY